MLKLTVYIYLKQFERHLKSNYIQTVEHSASTTIERFNTFTTLYHVYKNRGTKLIRNSPVYQRTSTPKQKINLIN